MSRRALARAIECGELVRDRRDRYVSAMAPAEVVRAVRIGGRVTCLSLLRLHGVFVFERPELHVHISRGMSRLRSPEDRARPLASRPGRRCRLHWRPLISPIEAAKATVSIEDALVNAIECQPPRYAIATLDSALNTGLIDRHDLADILRALPARFAVLASLVDARAQSGPETLVRLMLRSLGCDVAIQVLFRGIGTVDFVIDGWLVVECDSREFHSSWEQQVKDHDRDMALAAQGYSTLRLTAARIMYRPDEVLEALRALINSR